MRGKGGPENMSCKYRGVRQRTWGKWVSEISFPNRGHRIWIGTFDDSKAAALACDEAAFRIYGATAKLNFPEISLQVHSTASTSAGSIIDQDTVVDQSPYGNNLDIPNFIEKLIEMQQGENPPGDEVALIANPYACLVNDHVYDYHDQTLLQEEQRAVAPTFNHGKFEGSDVTKDDMYQKAKNDDNKEERMSAELPENDASPDEGIESFSKIKDLGGNIGDVSEHVGNNNWEEDLGSINIWF